METNTSLLNLENTASEISGLSPVMFRNKVFRGHKRVIVSLPIEFHVPVKLMDGRFAILHPFQ